MVQPLYSNDSFGPTRDAQSMWFNDLRKQNPDLAPIRGATPLFEQRWQHGASPSTTSKSPPCMASSPKPTRKNESGGLKQQMTHLGRALGNPLLTVSQKYLTGYPKGASGSWMLKGCLQILQSGLVPGNRNGNGIDPELKTFTHLV